VIQKKQRRGKERKVTEGLKEGIEGREVKGGGKGKEGRKEMKEGYR
jgi:hypothetical protein